MDVLIRRISPPSGTLSVPADKAICHRAVFAAALASGETEIRPWPSAQDCQRTLHIMMQLGIAVSRQADAVRIQGQPAGDSFRVPAAALDCGESATTMRLGAGVLAGVPLTVELTGGVLLCKRPMHRIIEPLTQMGAKVEAAQGEKGEPVPPLKVFGRRPLRGIRYELPVPSAQVKSAILFAGLSAQKSTTIVEPRATRDHTERMLRAFGAVLLREGNGITLEPGKLSSPGTIHVPGDFSSALYFLVAAASIPGSRITITQVSLNPTRTAALRVLERMGAQVTFHLEASLFEPSGSITVEARPLRGVVITPEEVPGLIDELPILMVAASCAQGRTRIEGAGELRVKETDRIQSMVDGLSRMGASISTPDTDVVEITGGALKGASVSAAGDHRTAMSLAVAALLAEGETLIQSAECVSKSFPDFFERLAQVCGSDAVRKVDKP